MKVRGPFVTLMSGLVVAGVLFGLSVAATNASTDAPPASAAAPAPAEPLWPTPSEPAASPSAPPATQPSSPPAAAQPPPATQPSPPPAAAQPPSVAQASYAGRVVSGAATLAIAVKNGTAIAYLCDGSKIEAWLKGTAANGTLDLAGAGGATLTGTYIATWADGTVSVGGRQLPFRITTAQQPSGLYRLSTTVAGAEVVGGWIRLANGEQVGMVTPRGGTGSAAPPLDVATGTVSIDGVTARPQPVDGSLGCRP